jgi:hypothetical protein
MSRRAVREVGSVREQGGFHDPYGIHEDRWISDGTPTNLVRDGDAESYDPPPADRLPAEPLVRSDHGGVAGPDDLLRSDGSGRPRGLARLLPEGVDVMPQFYPPGL